MDTRRSFIFPNLFYNWRNPKMPDEFEDEGFNEEELIDMGLDPFDPDYTELAPHGMSGDETDDEEVE
jgi:hypothetical protein